MEEQSRMKRVEIEENREENELMLELELSIGGIFGKSNNTIQGGRGVCRKRDEKVNKMVGSGSCGSISNELLQSEIVGQNDDVLEIEHVRKKEKIENVSKNKDSCSSSHQGGTTDDSRSNSSNSQIAQQITTTSTASDPFDPSLQPTSSSKQIISTNKLTEPSLIKPNNQSNPHHSSVSNPPSKLDTSSHQQQASFLARMPCVSTTGNGPNGKTINGFLYRYTKNEVSIVCVCHGHSFSPAGFVEHAGSVDIVHPLKHITIFPTAFT
ncbi:ninja family, Jas TPL-binding domain protein [Tanacetum coccineum]|uniref:Ninja-family protein n=1 Tax=Tanacetum coccineum TaxID=301880 RepID=A0ABQ4ZGM9_9ASTR